MKYYVICTTADGILFKQYKCIEGWTKDSAICWQFSKQGAEKIAERLNEKYSVSFKRHYNILKVER